VSHLPRADERERTKAREDCPAQERGAQEQGMLKTAYVLLLVLKGA